MAPFAAAQWSWVDYCSRFGVGHYPWSRWRVDTKGVPVTLLLTGHPPDVRSYPPALSGIALDAVVLASRNI